MHQVPRKVERAAVEIGEHLTTWRKLQGLTAQQVADRVGISRGTLRRVERGQPVDSMTLLGVVLALGQLDRFVDGVDPLGTDVGRLRASEALPERVRPRKQHGR